MPFARSEAARLDEARLQALELRIAAELASGGGGELVAELEVLTATHPLRERLWAQRMLALYPNFWQGIGEIMTRHDDLTASRLGSSLSLEAERVARGEEGDCVRPHVVTGVLVLGTRVSETDDEMHAIARSDARSRSRAATSLPRPPRRRSIAFNSGALAEAAAA